MFSVHTKTQSRRFQIPENSAFEKLRFLDVSLEIKVRFQISAAWCEQGLRSIISEMIFISSLQRHVLGPTQVWRDEGCRMQDESEKGGGTRDDSCKDMFWVQHRFGGMRDAGCGMRVKMEEGCEMTKL